MPLAPAKGTPKAPAAIEQADGSPKPTNTDAGADPTPSDGNRASKGSPNTNSLRTYEIADYRLERPEFRIYLSGEGNNCEYRTNFKKRERHLHTSAEAHTQIVDKRKKENRGGGHGLRPGKHEIVRRASEWRFQMPGEERNCERGDQKT